LAIALMLIYQWLAQAPLRALRGWMKKREENRALVPHALHFVVSLEKTLPAMKRKEMAYTITCAKGVLLFEAGKCQDALSLLQSFDRIWDESQREHLNSLIDQMQSLMKHPHHGEEE